MRKTCSQILSWWICVCAVTFVILYNYWRLCIVFFTWGPSVLFICDHSVFTVLFIRRSVFLFSSDIYIYIYIYCFAMFPSFCLRTAGTKHFKPFRLPNSFGVELKEELSMVGERQPMRSSLYLSLVYALTNH